MISPFVKLYVYRALWRKNVKQMYSNDILFREVALFNHWSGKIRYAWFWSAGTHVPNASATIPGIILVNAEWAVKIILENDNPIMHDAFSLTINHEITHHENDYSFFALISSDSMFVNWVNEVHHRDAILDKYQHDAGISRADLQNASDNYKQLTDEQAAEVLLRVANSSVSSTMGAAYSGSFFVPTHYEGMIVDANDVFAVGYTSDYKLNAGTSEIILCAVFTNDPYVPVFPMIYVGKTGFF